MDGVVVEEDAQVWVRARDGGICAEWDVCKMMTGCDDGKG